MQFFTIQSYFPNLYSFFIIKIPVRSFAIEIYSGVFTLNDALEKKRNLKDEIDKYKEYTTSKNPDEKDEEALIFQNTIRFLRGRQNVLNCFESKIFPVRKQIHRKRRPGMLSRVGKTSDRMQIKILTPKYSYYTVFAQTFR